MRFKEPYILFRKTLQSGKKIYYVSFYDANGKRRQLSTGQRRKSFAEQIAVKLYFEGKFYPNLPNQLMSSGQNSILQPNLGISSSHEILPSYPTFSEYTLDWFDYDKCDYIREKLVHGFHYTPNHAYRMKEYLNIRVTPFFGPYRINEIDEFIVEKFIEKLKLEEHLSNSTINNSIKILKVILGYAFRKNDIPVDIAKKIKYLKNDSCTRGIFTNEEAEKLFSISRIPELWKGNFTYFLMNYLSGHTGMRFGEVQALHISSVFEDHILVRHSWDEKFGLKDTKNHKERTVPISKDLYQMLQNLSKNHTEGEYVFSFKNGKTPACRHDMYRLLKHALNGIGISDAEIKERHLSFHSWRHFYNSKLINSGIPKSIVQSIIGHVNDDSMTERYTHVSIEEQQIVLGLL